jgi:hypothetical protein
MLGTIDEIERLGDYPQTAPQSFRDQIDRARAARENLAGQIGPALDPKGLDRSGELAPVSRPMIVRTLAGA